ncbi:Nnf1-domain-containing protein [Gaertneriomyces semiglobifer]|nr:Nnf1-domain-containing protein [Gaertneriomyces semiglobifer]
MTAAETLPNLPDISEASSHEEHEEGPRMRKLRAGFDAALGNCLKSCNYRRIADAFPRLAEEHADDLRSAHEQLVAFIRQSMKEEFDCINSERNVATKLNELDRIQAEATERQLREHDTNNQQSKGQGRAQKRTASGTEKSGSNTECAHFRVSPEEAVRAHVVLAKREEAERLRARIAEAQSANDELYTKLLQSREEVSSLQQEIKTTLGELLPPREMIRELHATVKPPS